MNSKLLSPAFILLSTWVLVSNLSHAATISVGTPYFPSGYQNDFDDLLHVVGHRDYRLNPFCGMISVHDNGHEDRRFQWATCSILTTGKQSVDYFYEIPWTNWDATWTASCPTDYVMNSVTSYHSDSREDRRFKFGCMKFTGTATGSCYWSGYQNGYDDYLHFTCSHGYVLTAVQSEHSNSKEDRRFNFHCCTMTD